MSLFLHVWSVLCLLWILNGGMISGESGMLSLGVSAGIRRDYFVKVDRGGGGGVGGYHFFMGSWSPL